MSTLGAFVRHVPTNPDRVDWSRSRIYLCGDCGAFPSSVPDTCAKCGGHATTVGLTREIATARLTEIFKAREEVRVEIGATRYACPCGHVRRFKPGGECGRCGQDKWGRIHTTEKVYLADAFADFHHWPEAKQAEFLVAVAFGAEIVKTCKRCEDERPCRCDENK